MDWPTFRSKYPELSQILPADFMTKADPSHSIRDNIVNDNDRYLNHLNELVQISPTSQIVDGSYENTLHRMIQFTGFKTELIASVVIEQYVCTLEVADTKEVSGNPDFTCKHHDLDFEVFRIGQGNVRHRIRRAAEEIFDPIGGCVVSISAKPKFNKMAQTGSSIRANEQAAAEIIDRMKEVDLNAAGPSFEVESDAISVKVERDDNRQNVGVIGVTGMMASTMIDYENIRNKIRGKTEKQRKRTPLVLVVNTDIDMLTDEELTTVIEGNQSNGMMNLFSENVFDYIAAIVFIDMRDECVVLPNRVSNSIDGSAIYQNSLSDLDGQNAFRTIESLYA